MIYKKPLFREILSLSLIVLFVHYYANVYSLYWRIEWLDTLMHFLGGLLIGLIALFVFFTSEKVDFPRDHKLLILFTSIGLVLVVGLAWELWELFIGFTDIFIHKLDTMVDLFMDVVGAVSAYYYGINKIWTKE